MLTATIAERNIVSAKKLIDEVINTHQLDLCDRYLAADRIDFQEYGLPPGAANGHEGFKRVLSGFLEAFPDLHIEVQFTVADDERTAFYCSTTGTHLGSFMGFKPTGKRFKVNGVDIFRFNDEGKIAAHWGVFDALAMFAQLGLAPSPEQS